MVEIKNKKITKRNIDFAQWYTDICCEAELMSYSANKGFIIYRPYGYAIWEKIKNYLDQKFKETGHENIYMPLVIPESLFNKEKEHVAGFAPEILVATIGGNEKLNENLVIRPTSEALFTDFYANIISSYRDLPKLYNQWCSVVRWEKTTRPFLRGSEFLWQEGHTMHVSKEEAIKETLNILNIYIDLGKKILAIPFINGQKSEKEKFAGAESTFTVEALMYDGKVLQCGTSHYFGQNFSKVFNVQFLDKDNKLKNPYQTSWGVSTRLIGALIMVHGDDNGLVLPPNIAPIKVIIIPIHNDEKINLKVKECLSRLNKIKIETKVDDSDHTPGWKFSEWEMKGVPLRLEIGLRDIQLKQFVLFQRYNGEKIIVKEGELEEKIVFLLEKIQEEMYKKALNYLNKKIIKVETLDELKDVVKNNCCAQINWCGNQDCEDKIKNLTTATLRCLPFNSCLHNDDFCPICKKKAFKVALFAKAY